MDLLPCCATKSPAPSGCMRRGAAGAEMAELVSVLVHLAHLPSVFCLAQPEDASCGGLALAHHLPWYVLSRARWSGGKERRAGDCLPAASPLPAHARIPI